MAAAIINSASRRTSQAVLARVAPSARRMPISDVLLQAPTSAHLGTLRLNFATSQRPTCRRVPSHQRPNDNQNPMRSPIAQTKATSTWTTIPQWPTKLADYRPISKLTAWRCVTTNTSAVEFERATDLLIEHSEMAAAMVNSASRRTSQAVLARVAPSARRMPISDVLLQAPTSAHLGDTPG